MKRILALIIGLPAQLLVTITYLTIELLVIAWNGTKALMNMMLRAFEYGWTGKVAEKSSKIPFFVSRKDCL